jgi:hypothetical protein
MKYMLLILALGLAGAAVAAESIAPPTGTTQDAPVAASPAASPAATPAPATEPVNLAEKCREAAQQQQLSPAEQEIWLAACLADAEASEIVDESPPVSTVRPPLR